MHQIPDGSSVMLTVFCVPAFYAIACEYGGYIVINFNILTIPGGRFNLMHWGL